MNARPMPNVFPGQRTNVLILRQFELDKTLIFCLLRRPLVLPADSPYLTGAHTMLFDLVTDLFEERDLASEYPVS